MPSSYLELVQLCTLRCEHEFRDSWSVLRNRVELLSELAFNLMKRKTVHSLMVFQSAGQLLQWRQIDN